MCKGSSLDSLGLVHFSIGLVNSVLNLPDGQEKKFGEFNLLQKNCNQSCPSKFIFRSFEMTLGYYMLAISKLTLELARAESESPIYAF